MVNKGMAAVVAGGIGILIAAVFIFAGPFQAPAQMQQEPQEVQPVAFSVNSIQVMEIDEQNATVEVAFDLVNPNSFTLVLEEIQYDLLADDVVLKKSSIGERLEGMVAGTGQTYYLVSEVPLTLKDTVQIKNKELFAGIWGGLANDDVNWRLKGSYIITDPVRAGGEEKDFDLTL